MNTGYFYFLKDQYFVDFPDDKLMKNKEKLEGRLHDRPCFYAFKDETTGLYWMIPFSSQVNKFERIYASKIAKYNRCDTIVFGHVLGHKKAFLIQNMCPVTKEYIRGQYIDGKTDVPVRIDGRVEKELLSKAKKVLALQRKGVPLIFPDVLKIEKQLLWLRIWQSHAPSNEPRQEIEKAEPNDQELSPQPTQGLYLR